MGESKKRLAKELEAARRTRLVSDICLTVPLASNRDGGVRELERSFPAAASIQRKAAR